MGRKLVTPREELIAFYRTLHINQVTKQPYMLLYINISFCRLSICCWKVAQFSTVF